MSEAVLSAARQIQQSWRDIRMVVDFHSALAGSSDRGRRFVRLSAARNSPHPCSWILKGGCLRSGVKVLVNWAFFASNNPKLKNGWKGRTLDGALAEGLVQAVSHLLEAGGR